MGRTRRACTRDCKQEAVKRVKAGGQPTAPVARDLGLTPNLLRRWKQDVAGDPVAAFPGKGRRQPHEEERARRHAGFGPRDAGTGLFKQCGDVLRQAVVMRCRALRAHVGRVPVRLLCRLLAGSPAGD